MALQVKVSIDSNKADSTVLISDVTGDKPSILDGYSSDGAGDGEERSDFGLVYVIETIVDDEVSYQEIYNSVNTTSSYLFEIDKDGVYGFNIIILPYFTSLPDVSGFEEDDQILVEEAESEPKVFNFDGTNFLEVDKINYANISSDRIASTNLLVDWKVEEAIDDEVIKISKINCNKKKLFFLNSYLNNIRFFFTNSDFRKAQDLIDRFQKRTNQ